MRAYTNMTTRRLEEVAQRVGVRCEIKIVEAQEDGRYFVFAVNDEPLKRPVPLGFMDDQAIYCLKRRAWERYALRGEPTRLPRGGADRRTGFPRAELSV